MAVAFYLTSILVANLLVIQYGIVQCGPISFPAGTPVIGLTFSARDFVQRRYGKWGAWLWMAVATLLTMALNWRIAAASGGAFIIAEALDWFVYTVSRRPLSQRIIISNLVSTPLDSAAFVTLAFGWNWPAIWGQTLVKFISSLVVLPWVKKS